MVHPTGFHEGTISDDMAKHQNCKAKKMVHPTGFHEGTISDDMAKHQNCKAKKWCTRQDSNLRPIAPEAIALSS